MNNIFNVRVRRLLKNDLLEYAKHFGWFMIIVIGSSLLNLAIKFFAGRGFNFDITFFGSDFDLREIDFSGIVNMISFGGIAIVMFIAGIVGGAELPSYVRLGASRKEYFAATTLGAIIISLVVAPAVLSLNAIINLLAGTENFLYNSLLIANGDIAVLAAQVLMYVALFLTGYSIAMIWQRVGWLFGLIAGFIIVIVTGLFGWGVGGFFNTFTIVIEDYWFEVNWMLSSGFIAVMALVQIEIFGTLTYTLLKNVPVKVK